MKRMSFIGAIGALTIALLVPASVSAHHGPTFWGHVDKAVCTNSGGKYGFGKVRLQMSAYARKER